jgi:hypothetical protein
MRVLKAGFSDKVFLTVLAFVSAFFGFIYVNMPVHMDEAVFLVIGERMVEGASLYSEISDIKLPGIFFLSYMLSVVFENPLLPARILVYTVNLGSGLLVFSIGRKLIDRYFGRLAALIFLIAAYSDHVDVYYFITEPFAVFFLLLSLYLFLAEKFNRNMIVVGIAVGVAVVFKQTVLIYIAVFNMVLLVNMFRESDNISINLTEVSNLVLFNLASAVPLLLFSFYFYLTGGFYEMFNYNFNVVLTDYNPPVSIKNLLIALVSVLPVWVLGGAEFLSTAYEYVEGRQRFEWLLIGVAGILLLYPAFRYWGGGHRIMFSIPFMTLLAAKLIYESDFNISVETLADRRAAVIIVLFGIMFTGYAYQLSDLEYNSSQYELTVDRSQEVYAFPFKNQVFINNNNLNTPDMYLGTIFSEELADIATSQLSGKDVEIIVVHKSALDEEYNLKEGIDLYVDRKKMYNYIRANYDVQRYSENFIIYRRST